MPLHRRISDPPPPPSMMECFYNSLDVLRVRSDKAMEVLRAQLDAQEELKRNVGKLDQEQQILKRNDGFQDSRITALEAELRMVRAELKLKSGPTVGAPGRALRGRTSVKSLDKGKRMKDKGSEQGNFQRAVAHSLDKGRVLCKQCGKDYAKYYVREHTQRRCPLRPGLRTDPK